MLCVRSGIIDKAIRYDETEVVYVAFPWENT
jgi:hypothetical protein